MTTTLTELYARWYNWIALWFLLGSLHKALKVAAFHASGQLETALLMLSRLAGNGFGLFIWLACFYFLYQQTRLAWTKQRARLFNGLNGLRHDDFVAQTLGRAGFISFMAMLLALPVCDWLSRRLEDLPAEYIVDFTYAVLLGSYSIAFLVLTHLAARAD